MVIDTRPPFEDSEMCKHVMLTFAYRVRSIMGSNPFYPGTITAEVEANLLVWLNELLPAVDSYRATLKILKAAYERGEL